MLNASRRRALFGPRAALLALVPLLLFASGCDAVQRAGGASHRVEIEAAVFEGGYGITWHKAIAEKYNALRAAEGVGVRLWGDPRVMEVVKPRILRGDPPDFMIMNDLPIWLLIATNKLLPFDAALDSPAYGSDKTWREHFIPGTLDMYASGGKTYAIPSVFNAWACWYDAKLFREHGWTPPKTFSEFDALCEKITAAGIAPIAYQGKYPQYAWWTYVALVQRCGGLAAVNQMNELKPGAFSHPGAIQAAALLQKMATTQFEKGAMAMTHTESQLEFVNNKAAMIFCGLWLPNEMKSSTPPDFEMRCFNLPVVDGAPYNPTLFYGCGWEFVFVPTSSKHPEETLDFCKYVVSPLNAPSMGEKIGVISPLKGATPKSTVGPPLQSAIDLIDSADGIFMIRADLLLLVWRNQTLYPALNQLMRGEITPDEFSQQLERGLAEVLADPDTIVPPCVRYDPAQFGEPA